MDEIRKLKQTLQRRVLGSVALYAVFFVYAVATGASGSQTSDSLGIMLLFLASSVAVLPRSAAPRRWPTAATQEAADQLDLARQELRDLQMRTTYLRVGYLIGAFFALVLLPRLGI